MTKTLQDLNVFQRIARIVEVRVSLSVSMEEGSIPHPLIVRNALAKGDWEIALAVAAQA